jgi:hypothetical protein
LIELGKALPSPPVARVRAWSAAVEARGAAVVAALEKRTTLRRALLFTFLCLCAAFYLRPVFQQVHALGIQDWDVHLAYRAVTYRTVVEHHQFPLWTPYHSGGLPFLANPQTSVLSPSTILVLATGPVVGVKLEIFFHYVIGLTGAYACARVFSIDRLGSVMTALVYMWSGMLAMSQCTGMTVFLSAAYIPWILFCLRRATDDRRFAAAAGVLFALMFFQGGVHLLVLGWSSLALFGLTELLFEKKHPRRFLIDLSLAGVVGLGVGAVKVLPVLELLRRLPRKVDEYSGYSLESLAHGLLAPNQDITTSPIPPVEGFLRGMSWGADENAQYVGATALLLMVVGLAAKRRKELPLIVTFVLLLWLSLGDRAAPMSSWAVLHRLPVFSAMRVAQRFRFVWMLILALFVGMGFQTVREWIGAKARSRVVTSIVTLAIVAIVCANLLENAGAYKTGLSISAPPPIGTPPGPFRQIARLPPYGPSGWEPWTEGPKPLNAWSALYPAVMKNVGSKEAYEPLTDGFESAVIPSHEDEYHGEAYVVGGTGTVQTVQWSPNRVVVDVEAQDSVSVVFNQNYFPGWRSSAGPVSSAAGLLSVPVAPGRQRLTLWYRPTSFVIGAWMSLLTAFGVAGFMIWGRRSPEAARGVRWTA